MEPSFLLSDGALSGDGTLILLVDTKYLDNQAKQQSSLNRHEKSVHDGFKYGCSYCVKKFTSQAYLRTHKRSVHEGV